jgi:aspartate/methionine/tyrosine aminotransferase
MASVALQDGANMRDIFDLCQRHGLPSLAQGMIELPPPQSLREIAARHVMSSDVHTYRPRMGVDDYRASIAAMARTVYGEQVAPENVLATPGVAGGVTAALLALRRAKPEATVAIMEPFYTYHALEVERVFGKLPATIPVRGADPDHNWGELQRRVKAGEVQGVIVTNPLNPSGHVFTAEQVNMLLDLSDNHGLFVILDECYLDMVFNGRAHASPIATGFRDNVVACRGFSKCLGCQSWRVGYAMSTPATLLSMMQEMDPLFICVNWAQQAFADYFREDVADFQGHVKGLNGLLQENWQLLSAAFQQRFGWEPIEPHGTMYGMLRHSEETDITACERALQAGVGICPGNVFFGDATSPPRKTGLLRIHCGVAQSKAQAIAEKLSHGSPGDLRPMPSPFEHDRTVAQSSP